MVSRWVRQYKTRGASAFDGKTKRGFGHDLQQSRKYEQENEQLKKLLGEKDLEIAILRDLVKKGTRL